jgi:hypothetical protein
LVNEKIADLQKQILEFKYIKVEREKDVQTKIFERSNLQIKITELQMLTEKINESEKELGERDLGVRKYSRHKCTASRVLGLPFSKGSQ